MNYFRLAFIAFILGVILIVASALITGDFSVFLFIPVFYGAGIFAIIGALLIILSLILFVLGFAKGLLYEEKEVVPVKVEKKTKAGGIVLLGPIPIIFGTDKSLVLILVVLAIILIIIMLALFLMLY